MKKKDPIDKNTQRIIMTFLLATVLLMLAAVVKTVVFEKGPSDDHMEEITLEPATKQTRPTAEQKASVKTAPPASKPTLDTSKLPGVGLIPPDFSLTTFDGKRFKLSDYRGKKPVLINLWASWCGPCKREAPLLEKAYQKYNDQGIEFIAVAVQDKLPDAKKFVETYNLSYPNGFDDTGRLHHAFKAFGVPETYILNKDGVVVFRKPGAVYEHMLMPAIEAVLKDANK